ncbi:MAG TPA: uroporphyrinogen-III C-methyltransferase [Dongiaceae bacterium]|jgi:uroporphyrin-III C-methyltransferase|nr:uroporphyrinogen-III C-methyltransferase [Dongiaceae bacterium]
MQEILKQLPAMLPGHVWLVGAGPGEPGLLSLLAYKALSEADIIVYDALVGKEILQARRPEAQLHFAGKRGGKPSARQPDISQAIIDYARRGLRVLRLKGGDPFVFGRGGEEALALAAAHIPFRVVPGISAGIGGLAYAGIPVTHRECNSVVAFVTGHDASGDVPSLVDWQALARAAPVIVLYMALKHLAEIRAHLLEAGRDGGEALAIISNATTPQQRVLVTDLERCVSDVERHGIEPPAVIVLGEVVALRPMLDWMAENAAQHAG